MSPLRSLRSFAIAFVLLASHALFAQAPLIMTNNLIVEQAANHMIADTLRNRLLITIPSSDFINGNSLSWLDPGNGELGGSYVVGSEPNVLALSDDRLFAYVGFLAGSAVKRFDLSTNTIQWSTSMGVDQGGYPFRAGSIAFQPGSTDVIAVAKEYFASGGSAELAVFEEGVQRPSVSTATFESIHFEPNDPEYLVALMNDFNSPRIRTYSVSSSGLQIFDNRIGLFDGLDRTFQVDGFSAFVDDGSVLNLALDAPEAAGAFALPMGSRRPRVCVDTYNDMIVFAYRDSVWNDTLHLVRYDRATYEAVDRIAIPDVALPGQWLALVQDLVCWGPASQYAVNMSNDRIVIIDGIIPTSIGTQRARVAFRHDGSRLWFDHPGLNTVELFDGLGRGVASSFQGGAVDISGLLTGTYIVRATDRERNVHTVKFALVR